MSFFFHFSDSALAEWIRHNVVIVVISAFALIFLIIAVIYLIRRSRKKQTSINQELDMAEIIMGEKIGRGSFADVYRAKWRHTDVAVKKLVDVHLKQVVDDFSNETNLMLYDFTIIFIHS